MIRHATAALPLLCALAGGCEKGFGVSVDVDRGCLKNPVSGAVTVALQPSGVTSTTAIADPAGFFSNSRRVVVVPPSDTTAVAVGVTARDADGTSAAGSVTVAVAGHQVARASLVLAGCAGGPAPDLAKAPPDLSAAVDEAMPPPPPDLSGFDAPAPVDAAVEPADLYSPPDLLPMCAANQLLITGGTFMMGANDLANYGATPVHQVTVTAFCLDTTEVTMAAYAACVKANKCTLPMTGGACNWGVQGRDDHPINCIDWNQANDFCKFSGGRLPTEAQWEFAARFDDGRDFPWGNARPDKQLCWGRMSGSCPVKSFPAGDSKLGFSDFAGNVFEVVTDCFDAYPAGPVTNPTGPAQCLLGERVARGGGWVSIDSYIMRTAYRHKALVGEKSPVIGVRCARY